MVTWALRICAIVLALTLFTASWSGLAENRAFRAHGARARVDPIEKYTVAVTTRTNLGVTVEQSRRKSAKISFTTRDRQRVTVNRVLPEEVLAAFRSGADVFIDYLPADPTTTRVPGHESRPLVVASLGVLVVALTWVFWQKMRAS